jgi:hypothetical protein
MACPFSSVLLVSSSRGSQQMRQNWGRGLEVTEVTEVSGMLGMNWSPGIGCMPLRKNDLFVSIVPHSDSSTELFAKNSGTETESTFTRHLYLLGTINSMGIWLGFSLFRRS